MKRIGVVGVPGGWSSELLADKVREKTGFRLLIDLKSVALDLPTGRVLGPDGAPIEVDALILKKAGTLYAPHLLDRLEILRFLKAKGVKIFSDPEVVMRMLDRMSCTVTLAGGGVPMPKTRITESEAQALSCVEEWGRTIFKPLYSTKARGMTLIERGEDAADLIAEYKSQHQVMYIQALVEHPGYDLGVTFLGGKYLATYARAGSKDSWNTTIFSGGKYAAFEPSAEILDMAEKAQKLFGLDFTCVDVVETADGPLCYEVSAFGGFRGLLDANGIDAASLYVDHVLARLSC